MRPDLLFDLNIDRQDALLLISNILTWLSRCKVKAIMQSVEKVINSFGFVFNAK